MRRLQLILLLLLVSTVRLCGQAAPPVAHGGGAESNSGTERHGRTYRGEPIPLTLEQALSLADQNSPLLGQAKAEVSQSEAAIRTAKAYTNPSVEVLAGRQDARPIATPGVPGAVQQYGASQTIEIPAERRTRIAAAELEKRATSFRLDQTRLTLAANVKRAFYDVIRRKEQLAIAQNSLTLLDDLRHRIQLQVEVGEMGRLELTRAEAERSRAQSAVRAADVQLSNARAMLKAVIGSQAHEIYDATGTLGEAVTIGNLFELRQLVLSHHPTLAEAKAAAEKSRTLVQNEQAKRIPMPTFTSEYERQPDLNLYRFGVSIPVPLWDKRKGQIAEATAAVRRSEAVAQQRSLEVTAALERAYDQYQISNEQVEGLQAGTLKGAEAAVDAARAAFKFGERGIVEVLDAQRVLQGVRNDLLDALYARRSAVIDLEELGVTLP